MLQRFSRTLSSNQVIALFSLYAMLVFNIGYWQHTYRLAGHDWLLLATMPLFIVAAMNFVVQLLFWPKLHRLVMPLLLLVGAGASYAVMVQGVYFNGDQINNIMQTDATEASAWLSVKFIGWLVLTGVLPALWYVFCVTIKPQTLWRGLWRRILSVLASLLLIGALAGVAYSDYASFFRNHKGIQYQITPTNILGSSIKVAYDAYDARRPFEPIGEDAKRLTPQGARKKVLVLVVGETTRAQNWGLNPSAPETTPQLAKTDGVINYPDALLRHRHQYLAAVYVFPS